MKRYIKILLVCLAFISCHGGEAGNTNGVDSLKSPSDTAGRQMIPGSPGPSGTAPTPGDTTKAHKDSLKMAHDLADSTAGPKTNP